MSTDRLARAAHDAGASAELPRFIAHLNELSAHRAARINPFEFAAGAGIVPDAALDIFIHGAKLGAFDLEWGSVCPLCGAIMQTAEALDHVAEDSVFCSLCQRDIDSVLDDSVEVTFAYAEADPADLHSDFETHQSYYTSSSYPYRAQWRRYFEDHMVGSVVLEPGAAEALSLDLVAGETYRLACLDTHAGAVLEAGQGDTIEFALAGGRFDPPSAGVPAGRNEFRIRNNADQKVWIRVFRQVIEDVLGIVGSTPPEFGPRLTGKRLINTQSFRDCFAMRELAPDLKLKLRSLTILFSDLKGSTALYDREGDLAAYRLVQDHFTALKSAVSGNSGAMIKTMGDAIMAAFPSGESGAKAAIQMMAAMQDIAGGRFDEIGLKVGLHAGPALAINSGGVIDYFGQTVNIAARVQGLADAGDICVTSALNNSEPVAEVLTGAGYIGAAEISHLKGVSAAERIFRYRPL